MISKELIEKAKKCTSKEELLELAKSENIELNDVNINNLLASNDTNGMLSDDELENVTGGTCYSKGVTCPQDCGYEESRGKFRPYVIVTAPNTCDKSPYTCGSCGWHFSEGITMYCAARWKGHDTLVYDSNGNAMHYTYD